MLPVYWTRRLQQTLRYVAYISLLPLILAVAFAGFLWHSAEGARATAEGARATAVAAGVQANTQKQAAEAAALTLHALARSKEDYDFSLRTLLSAANRGKTPLVDQAMRQILEPQPCGKLNRQLYDVVWPADQPILLVGAADGKPEASQNLPA